MLRWTQSTVLHIAIFVLLCATFGAYTAVAQAAETSGTPSAQTFDATVTQPGAASDTAVVAQTAAAVDGDRYVARVEFAASSVSITYPVRARLFGMIPATFLAEARVSSDGTVQVEYPWYSFLFSVDQASIQTKLQAVGKAAASYDTHTFTTDQQLALLALLHSALQSSFGTSTAASSTLQ